MGNGIAGFQDHAGLCWPAINKGLRGVDSVVAVVQCGDSVFEDRGSAVLRGFVNEVPELSYSGGIVLVISTAPVALVVLITGWRGFQFDLGHQCAVGVGGALGVSRRCLRRDGRSAKDGLGRWCR